MSEATFHTTQESLRKEESRTSKAHGGKNPPGTSLSAMKSIIDSNTNKPEQINQVQSNLPLPDQPPAASDWNSMDQRTTNVGSGRFESSASRDKNPATAESSVRVDGDEWHKHTEPGPRVGRQGDDNLEGLPRDALAR